MSVRQLLGPMCVAQLGENWIDAGTLTLTQTSQPGTAGLRSDTGARGGSEFSPLTVQDIARANISIDFEGRDLSVGKARYTGAKQISPNFALKPSVPGHADNPMAHANVEVHLRDAHGNEVRMTRRLVRYWFIKPSANAAVDNLNQWRIVGMDSFEGSPFADSVAEQPAGTHFEWDRPSAEDAPGFQGISVDDPAFGQLQEFVVGNPIAGGAYYQIYVLDDGKKVRVITSKAMTFSPSEYRSVLRLIDNKDYSKTMLHKLFFMPAGATDNTTVKPPASAKSVGQRKK